MHVLKEARVRYTREREGTREGQVNDGNHVQPGIRTRPRSAPSFLGCDYRALEFFRHVAYQVFVPGASPLL